MRIFIFASTYNSVNSYRPEIEIFCGLAESGHQVTVMSTFTPELTERYRSAGVKLIEGKAKKKICFESIKKIRQELAANDYDIVYATNSKTIPNAGFACIGFNVKFVVYRGTTGGIYRHDPTAYLTALHPRVDGVVCVSRAVEEDIKQRVWKNKNNVVTIYKGHLLEWYDIEPADLTEFGISPKDFTLICAVNARPSKGISVMLEAADQLADINNLHLLLVGKGMDQEPYASLIANNKMKDRIHLAGYRYDTPALIKASNLLVQPSISGEGLPRAMMEAMGLGTPVIITTTGGGKEIVDDGKSGFVVPIKSADSIVKRVRELYVNPELIKSMVKYSKEKISGPFSSKETVKNYIKYFESLLKKK